MFDKSIPKMIAVAEILLIIVSSAVAMERAASIEYGTVEQIFCKGDLTFAST